MTSAERCAKEQQDVKRAKRRLARAKHAEEHRGAKVRKAKANLKRQKRQKASWCRQAANEADATTQADATKAAWDALRQSAPVQALPKDVQKEMFGTVSRVLGTIDTLKAEQIPGATPEELSQIEALLTALDPATIQAATTAFVEKMKSATSKPDTLSALITTLLSGLPVGTVLPPDGNLAKLQKAMQDVVAALKAFQPNGGQTEVAKLVKAIQDATAGLQAAAESGDLEQLLDSVTQVNGGNPPSEDELAALFDFLLNGTGTFPFPLPQDVDGLGALDTLLGSASGLVGGDAPLPGAGLLVPEVTEIVTDLVDGGVDPGDLGGAVDPGGIIGGIIGGLPVPLPPLPLFP
jgi:hypothetical protein